MGLKNGEEVQAAYIKLRFTDLMMIIEILTRIVLADRE
jgi:hypothetical protein